MYDYLQSQMKTGALLPGSVLNLKSISQKLGLSNTPLRDSLLRLEAEGYLSIFPRSKVIINSLELEDFPYLYGIMGTIEFTVISRSLPHYTSKIIKKLRTLDNKMKEALEEGDIVLYDTHHYAYHAIFFEVSPNLFAERILTPIKNRLWISRVKIFTQNGMIDP